MRSTPTQAASSKKSQEPNKSTRPPILSGTIPGILDPSQAARLLRFPGSELTFATFDPLTADSRNTAQEPNKPPSHDRPYPPKRIVIETTPAGASSWRYVPHAELAEGVTDEGFWPREIDVCGERYFCFRNQWDIYKLDPEYRCFVGFGFELSTISKVAQKKSYDADPSQSPSAKRSRSLSPEQSSNAEIPRKKNRAPSHIETEDVTDEEEEVAEMITDDLSEGAGSRAKARRQRARVRRANIEKDRNARWEHLRSQDHAHAQAESSFQSSKGNIPPESPTKRKAHHDTQDSQTFSDNASQSRPNKRAKAMDLPPLPRTVAEWKAEKEKRRREKIERTKKPSETLDHLVIFDEAGNDADIFEAEHMSGSKDAPDNSESEEEIVETKQQKEAAERLAESIRKMRELEADRPLWEEARKKREASQKREEEQKRAAAEQRRKEEARLKAEEAQRKEEEIRRREEEARRKAKEGEEQRRRLKAQQDAQDAEAWKKAQTRQQDYQPSWETGTWNYRKVLDRFVVLSERFDSPEPIQPLKFQDIPWPTLAPYVEFGRRDMSWGEVENFFKCLKRILNAQDYKAQVIRCHKRFHPDRWRARKVFAAVQNENERTKIEATVNVVSQALTPIWMAVKDR